MKIAIIRTEATSFQTLGELTVLKNEYCPLFKCKTLELPWLDNKRRQSCIPVGDYEVVKWTSPTFGDCFHITNVPDRDLILIHPANFRSDLLGCIAVGEKHTDINGDGNRDVTNSKATLKMLLTLLPKKFSLKITNQENGTIA
jgi:hypothetical protein